MNGITFLGKHSYKDLGITMSPERGIGIPNKIKNKHRVPFSNVTYDFSRLYGEETYGERTLTYNFNIGGIRVTKEQMIAEKTKIVNWLMHSDGKQTLYDDTIPGWHFLAEVEGGMAFQENWRTGILTVTFTAYPFMIRDVNEGGDIWDTFNFDYDVSQKTAFSLGGGWDINGLNELNIGELVNIGAWAVYKVNAIGRSRSIVEKRASSVSWSNFDYKLEGIEEWIYGADIIQAQRGTNRLDISINNNGAVSVGVEVRINGDSVSIVKDGDVYNFSADSWTQSHMKYTNDGSTFIYGSNIFRLKPGENIITLYTHLKTDIEFRFYKELI